MKKKWGGILRLALIVGGFLVLSVGSRSATALTVAEWGDAGFLDINYQLQARYGIRDQGPDLTKDKTTKDLYLRRNRLSFLGMLNEDFGYTLQVEYNGSRTLNDTRVAPEEGGYEFNVLDYYITADATDYLRFRVGKTKHVLTREVSEGCFDPLSIDRSVFILGPFVSDRPEKTTRDYGVVVWGNFMESKLQYRLAVMDGNRYGADRPDDIGFRYTGRLHVTLLDPEAGLGYKGSYLGKKKVLTVGAGYETQPDAVFDSNATGATDYKAYTYDLFYERPTDYGTFTLSGAYLKADFGDAGMRGVTDAQGANGEKNGSYWKAGYMLGKAQVYGRYEDWAFAQLNSVDGQNVTLTAGGVNYYFKGQNLRLTVEYTITDFDKEKDSSGNVVAKDFTTILSQLQLKF